jgi:O-antigen/teichoic acid export membrane protein
MILARLLAPEDFGLMAMAGVATAVATLLADLGLGSALMHFPRPERRTLSTIYWLSLGMSIFLAGAFALAASPVALVYGQPELVPLLWWLSLAFPLGALGQLFRVMAEKELQFPRLARHEILASLLGFLAALAVAASGGGVFAFVAGTLAAAAAGSVLAWLRLSAGIRPTLEFSLGGALPFLRFGLHRVGGTLWNTLSLQADVFIAGLHSSPATIALYTVPREQCLRISNTVVNPVVTRVGLPVMTRLQGDTVALRSVYLQTLRMTASMNFPLYALLVMFPGEIIVLLLGAQWHDAAFYLRLFALWGLIRSTGNPSGSLIFAVGMARRAHLWNLALLVAIVPPLWLAAGSGLPILAWVMCLMQVIIYVLAWRFLVLPACGVGFIEYNRQLAPPFLVTLLAAVLTYFATQPMPAILRLPVGAILLASLYLLLSWKFNAVWLRAMIELADPLVKIISPRK